MTCIGAFIHPTAYTLTAVTSLNGSPVNGSCPQECVGGDEFILCDCINTALNITGVLIDGVVPTIDITQRRTTWARQLLTVRTGSQRYVIGFRFGSRIIRCEVELYVFHCPSWNIGADTINIYNALTFPFFIKQFNSAGNVTLTSDMENCESLTRVSIPLQTAMNTSNYFIEFTNSNGMQVQQVYIGEVRFSDQPTPNPEEMNTTTYTHSITTSSIIFTANVPQPTTTQSNVIQPFTTEPTKPNTIIPRPNMMTPEATDTISKYCNAA